MENIKLFLANFFKVLGRLSFTQKIVLGTLFITACAVFTLMFNAGQSDYDVMFSGLDEADAAAVVGNLKKQGIPYQLAENGTTILVPKSKKEELRLDAFKEDLIKSDNTLGFDALGSLPFGMTSWQEQKYDQKMISDEVVKTLERIQGIKKARVLLAQPKSNAFSEDTTESSASVMLITEPGFRLKPAQVRTIKQMVSHAVPGMKPENVAVADSSGNILAEDTATGLTGEGQTEADTARMSFEKQKAKDIQELLAPLVGPGNVVVKVSATINYDQSQSKVKRYIPNGGSPDNPTGIPVSIQNNVEEYAGKKEDNQGGQPGVASNTPTIGIQPNTNTQGTEEENKGQYKNQQTITNFEVSSEEKTTVHAAGKVEKLSVAVVVNKVLNETETKELKDLILSAAGIDSQRGDTIAISGMGFSQDALKADQATLDVIKQSDFNNFILMLVQFLGLFLLAGSGLFIFYRLIRNFTFAGDGDDYDNYYDEQPRYLSGQSQDEIVAQIAPSIPILETKMDPEVEYKRGSISGMVNQDPAEAARLLKTFMKD